MSLIQRLNRIAAFIAAFLIVTNGSILRGATLVEPESDWRYLKGQAEASSPMDAWREVGFDDSGWPVGQTPIYYDNNDEINGNTLLDDMRQNYTSVYMRRTFTLDAIEDIGSLSFAAIIDDGYIAWINGHEIHRSNVDDGELAYDHRPTPVAIEPIVEEATILDPQGFLVVGENVLAIHAFNRNLTSSDFVIDAALVSNITETIPPTLTNIDPANGAVLSSLTQIAVTFSEPVIGVAAEDLLVNGVPAESVSGSETEFVFAFEQPAYGTVNVAWDASTQIVDFALPPNAFDPSGTWSYSLVDTVAPEVDLILPAPGMTVRSMDQIQVSFTEAVVGVDAGDLRRNGQGASNVSGAGAGPYVFSFPEAAAGTATISWSDGHSITDEADPANAFVGQEWSVTVDPTLPPANVRINEFLASNRDESGGLRDEDGELSDWIELFNAGEEPVNLAGWSITDDANDSGRWMLPAVTLDAGEFLILFASGKDRSNLATGRHHTNFRLNGDGDYLGLFNAEVPRVAVSEFEDEFPEQRADISYGLDMSDIWRYFANPTPGSANGSSTIEGVLPAPHFNVKSGYFENPFELVMSCEEPGVEIRIEFGGGAPDQSSRLVFGSPITIARSQVVRAVAFKDGFLPSRTTTHTYIFLEEAINQAAAPSGFPQTWGNDNNFPLGLIPADYEMDPEIIDDPEYAPLMREAMTSLPIVSLAMEMDDLFDEDTGIYANPEPPSSQRYLWERPGAIEFVPNDGSAGFSVEAGVRISGNASRTPRKLPKHSFRLLFKGDYGPTRLEYPVYPDSPVSSFDTIVLRGGFNYSWLHWSPEQRQGGTRIRDAWAKDVWRAMGNPGSHSLYFHLYVNGVYWGVYDFGEKIDASFAANYLGGEPEDYDAMASKPTRAIDGDQSAYNQMVNYINSQNMGVVANYTTAQQYLDMNSYIDYLLLNFYGANRDWGFNSNWNAIRPRGGDGRYQYIVWDAEQVIVGVNDNRVNSTDVPSGIHNELLDSAEYRLAWADRAHKHLFNGGVLTPEAAAAAWSRRVAEMQLPIIAESARWGDYRRDVHQHQNGPYDIYTPNDYWHPEIERMLNNYFPQRTGIFLQQLRSRGLYPNVDAPAFNQHGGRVPVGFNLTMSAGSTIYYTTDGTDPRDYGSGAVSDSALVYDGGVALGGSVVVKARARSGSTWSALNEASFTVNSLTLPIRITELMYDPVGGNAYEFVELQNIGDAPIDVGGFSIGGIGYVFPTGTMLSPDQVIVLASNETPGNWAARYPGVEVFGWFSGRLDNAGEKLTIRDPDGAAVWSMTYDNSNGWPSDLQSGNSSIEMFYVYDDPSSPANWFASSVAHGTPGQVGVSGSSNDIRINEVMAENLSAVENDGAFPDWIELRNDNESLAVDLSGWSLTDDGDPRKFVFPEGTELPPGGFLVIWCDAEVDSPGIHTGFGLGRRGDRVVLYDENGSRVDIVEFGPQVADLSIGRLRGGAWQLATPTPGAQNVSAATADTSSLTINEWLANSLPGESDWIELHNTSSQPVSLKLVHLGNGERIHQLGSISFVEAGGFVQLFADEDAGPDHLDFKLSAVGGEIVLYDSTGLMIEQVNYASQAENVSRGRLPDSASNIVDFPSSQSPGASNHAFAYSGPVLNEVLAINRDAVSNAEGRFADFVELFNDGAESFDLSGMALSENADKPTQWVFPVGTEIPAGGYLVVWFDGDRPASTESGLMLNTGRSLSGDRGTVVLFEANGLIADSISYGPQVRNLSIGRVGNSWELLDAPTPGGPNGAAHSLGGVDALRINEWLAGSPDGDDWFELHNGGTLPVSLSGMFVTDDLSIAGQTNTEFAPLSFIDANGFVVWSADGDANGNANQVNFRLDGAGEAIRLYSPTFEILDTVYFGLTMPGVSEGRLPNGAETITSFVETASPGSSNHLPLESIVINEVLAHTDPPFEDAIELHNLSDGTIDLGGWFLSDDAANLTNFRISDATTIPAGGYAVFYAAQFGGGEGSAVPFTLNSARGDEVYLSQGNGGGLTGLRTQAEFGPSANGVSFGRYETSSGVDFVAQRATSFGADDPGSVEEFRTGNGLANVGPLVGPIVISEIMYHPAGDSEADLEFIEIRNTSDAAVDLFDPAFPENRWRLRGGVDLDFPAGARLLAGEELLLVGFDPADTGKRDAFLAAYSASATIRLIGPWNGRLANGGERVVLRRPDTPQTAGPDAGLVPFIDVEAVRYADASPWPPEADGSGLSIHRSVDEDYGNDPLNWLADAPSPGGGNVIADPDRDMDGLPNDWELANGLDPDNPDDWDEDLDLDGLLNWQEFELGTKANEASSRLALAVVTQTADSLTLQFDAVAGRTYEVVFIDELGAAAWQVLETIIASESGMEEVVIPIESGGNLEMGFVALRVMTSSN